MKGRKINDTAIKARQIPDDHCVRAAFWTSMFQPQAPCFILKKMVWNPGEKDFYFSCPPGKDLILFIYCTKGECSITASGQTFVIKSGQTFIFNIKDGYEAKALSKEFGFIWIQIFGDLSNAVLEHILKNHGHISQGNESILSLCRQIFSVASHGWSYDRDIQISCLLYNLLGALHMSRVNDNVIQNAVVYMQEHYQENLTTPLLARLCFLGTSQFISRFKKNCSATPMEYLTNLRIDKAKNLLLTTDMPVSTVAHTTGFEDTSYFTRVFKKITGQTPREFRKSLLGS
ncbi:AraC-like DNA-binding protein [Catenibacillus scindens]|uniref:AraC-like DNA-binding protein n=1 Tax=Catenibacillus scindens TaxID=673271 RepID=A0A7W8M4J4_9FIRM|nr:AraC family transcriptional regulator [Catenibacillus scindens]MBB5263889.1 AraC-like DNA-binding protein [Catenibacillus scindens]